jgi:hypothetical protein
MQYWAKEDVHNIMFTCCVLHNILLDHDAWEWTARDDTDDVGLPSGVYGLAGRPDITDFSYMSGPDNNIPVEECKSEASWNALRALLITHYKYAKLNHLIRWVTYKKPNE